MKLIAYRTNNAKGWELEPAPKNREWMDETPHRFAYRCLPMVIANQAGWVIRCPVSFSVRWNGRLGHEKTLKFKFAENPEGHGKQILSSFGSGILTFAIPWLFRTEPGISLLVRGLPNAPKFNCNPLEGCVETDWSPFTFTMNWKIQLPWAGVRFEKGEPICFIQPISPGLLEDTEPVEMKIEDDPELKDEHEGWAASRIAFNEKEDRGNDWQKHYFKGKHHSEGKEEASGHRTELRIRPLSVDKESDEG